MNRFNKLIASAIALVSVVALSGCDNRAAQAPQQVVYQQAQAQPYQGAYMNDSVSCPVPAIELQNTFAGAYGVDGRGYPVNRFGFPVDTNGNCTQNAPASDVWPVGNGIGLAPIYHHYYASRWGVWYAPRPLIIVTPGIHYGVGTRLPGYSTRITTYSAPAPVHQVTVPVGASRTVTPGGSVGSPARTVVPAAVPVAPRGDVSIKPPAPAAAAPAPAVVAPRAVSNGSSSSISRPAPAYHAPAYSPPARSAPSYVAPRSSSTGSSSSISRGRR